MRLTFFIVSWLAQRLPPQELVTLSAGIWPIMWQRIPKEQRVDFLKSAADNYINVFLSGLSHRERVDLMNALLPIAAREFPLAEMDFLSAFAEPGERYQPDYAE